MLDELVGGRAELVVESVEIAGEGIAFKLVLNGSCDENPLRPRSPTCSSTRAASFPSTLTDHLRTTMPPILPK